MRKKVIWTRFIDAILDSSAQLPDAADSPPEPYRDTEIHELDDVLKDMMGPQAGRPLKLIQGESGIFGVAEHSLPSKVFKMFVCHTNFNIDASVAYIVKKIPGVEVFRVVSRYRFELGVGMAFDSVEIRRNIQRELCGSPESEIEELNAIAESLNEDIGGKLLSAVEEKISNIKDKYWAVYVLPNGSIEMIASTKLDFDYLDRVNELIVPLTKVGGCLLLSP